MKEERWRSVSWRMEQRALIDAVILAVLVAACAALTIFDLAL